VLDVKHRGGGITRVGDRWRARLRVDGQTVSLGYYPTEDEAEAAITSALAARDTTITAAQPLAHWGDRVLDRRELRAISSVQDERGVWRRHVEGSSLGQTPLRHVTRVAVIRWLDHLVHDARAKQGGRVEVRETERRLSRQTIVHALRLVRTVLTAAADAGLIPVNPALDVRVPAATDEAEGDGVSWAWLTADEIAMLLASSAPERHRLTWTVAIYTGLRRSEMRALQWRDVHLDGEHPRLTLRTTKNRQAREVPLLPPAREALKRWRTLSPGVGPAHVWRPARLAKGEVDAGRMGKHWDLGWRRHGEPKLDRHVRVHDLRHTCASHLVQGTWGRALSLYETAQWLGHSSIDVTERYAHLAPEGLRGAAQQMTAALERTKSGPADRRPKRK